MPLYEHCVDTVAEQPTSLTAVTSRFNSKDVNITVSWESQHYAIYYQTKGGPVISHRVFALEHLLDGLQRGVTYYISIVALSPHLPSPLVGPITVIPGESLTFQPSCPYVTLSLDPLLIVDTSPESLTASPNSQFSVNCTARAEVDGQSIPVDIEWTRIDVFSHSGPTELMPTLYTTTGSPERGYESVLTTSENDTANTIIYRCTATVSSHSNFSETTVHLVKGTNN